LPQLYNQPSENLIGEADSKSDILKQKQKMREKIINIFITRGDVMIQRRIEQRFRIGWFISERNGLPEENIVITNRGK
jgi:hypothetical protein